MQRHWGYLVRHVSLTYNSMTDTPPPPNAVVSITFSSWNAMFLSHRIRMRPHTRRNKSSISPDQWTRFQLWIFQRRWSRDPIPMRSFYGSSSVQALLIEPSDNSPLTDSWPQKFNSSRILADVAKRFLLAHWAISLSSLCVVLRGLSDRGGSLIIPVACTCCIRQSITEWCTPIVPPFTLPLFNELQNSIPLFTLPSFNQLHNYVPPFTLPHFHQLQNGVPPFTLPFFYC